MISDAIKEIVFLVFGNAPISLLAGIAIGILGMLIQESRAPRDRR